MGQDPTAPASSDAELITRVRSGDRAAFGTLYARHATAATNLARQFARSSAEVDDLVSEAFARVLDTLLAGRGPDTAFRAYLFTTLRNTAFDRSRKDSRLQFTDDVTVHETAEVADDPVVLELENTLVAKAFATLPERWQTVLWHTQVEGQSPAEVGVLLGMTANAVTSLAFRAREGLREAYLQAHLADTAAERCRATVDRLGGWARGGLSKREQAQVDAHLVECDRCRALAAELAEINSGLRGLLAPLLLGGAAAGYLATTSSTGAAVLVTGGAAGAGAAVGAGASTGSGSSGGGFATFLAKPWTIAAGGVAVAAAVVVTLVITLTGGTSTPAADRPPAVTPAASAVTTPAVPSPAVTSPAVTSPAVTSPAVPGTVPGLPPAPPAVIFPEPAAPSAPPAPTTASQAPVAPPPPIAPERPAPPPVTAPPASTSRPAPTSPPARSSVSAAPTSPPSSRTSATSPSPVPPPPTPASVSAPRFDVASLSATAGAPATVSYTVDNSGDTDSPPQQLRVAAPDGVSVAGAADSSQASGLRRPSALLAVTATQPSAEPAEGPPSLTYTVPAHQTVTVTLTLTVAPDAQPGDLALSINDKAAGAPLAVIVAPGLSDLHLGDPNGGWRAGTTTATALTAAVAPGVTQPGTISMPKRNGALWITDFPKACDTSNDDPAITCSPITVDSGIAKFGDFSITLLPGAIGDQEISATLPGGRRSQVVSGNGKPIDAQPIGTTSLIDITGPFTAYQIGAPTMRCVGHESRADCIGADRPMSPYSPPVTVHPPRGASNVLWAELTWAALGPAPSGGQDPLSSVTLHLAQQHPDQHESRVVSSHTVTAEPGIVVHTADVTDLLRSLPDTDSIWVDGLAAVKKSQTISGSNYAAMGAWALTVISSDDAVHSSSAATQVLYRNGTLKSSPSPTRICILGGEADCSLPTLQTSGMLHVALWGADDWGTKSLEGSDADPRGIVDGEGAGFDSLTASVPPAEDVGFSNIQAQDGGDSLWLGPTLVIRKIP